MKTFDFVFILLILNRVFGILDMLCQALQVKSQDIINALALVSSTKQLPQELRDDWDGFLESVQFFCKKYDINVPNKNEHYMEGTRHSCQQKKKIYCGESLSLQHIQCCDRFLVGGVGQ